MNIYRKIVKESEAYGAQKHYNKISPFISKDSTKDDLNEVHSLVKHAKGTLILSDYNTLIALINDKLSANGMDNIDDIFTDL